jgi:hypothetical protein
MDRYQILRDEQPSPKEKPKTKPRKKESKKDSVPSWWNVNNFRTLHGTSLMAVTVEPQTFVIGDLVTVDSEGQIRKAQQGEIVMGFVVDSVVQCSKNEELTTKVLVQFQS